MPLFYIKGVNMNSGQCAATSSRQQSGGEYIAARIERAVTLLEGRAISLIEKTSSIRNTVPRSDNSKTAGQPERSLSQFLNVLEGQAIRIEKVITQLEAIEEEIDI
jgi:uncharacterized protein Yka (UPF0111/DUF47 family)